MCDTTSATTHIRSRPVLCTKTSLRPPARPCVPQENFLEGILPGVSLAAPNERYAEDIFGGGDGDTADELLSMLEGEGDGEEADGEGEA